MMDFLVLILGLAVVALSWRNEQSRGEVKTLKGLLTDQRCINEALNELNRRQKAQLEAPTPSSPEPDCFLEIADLRGQLSRALDITDSLHAQLESERRTSANLRGQITKLKPKAKAVKR